MYKKCKARDSPEAKAELKKFKEMAHEQMRARWKFVNNTVNKALEANNSRPLQVQQHDSSQMTA